MYRKGVVAMLVGLLSLVGCDHTTPDFYYTQNGLKYAYHDIVSEGKTVKIGDYLTVLIEYKTADDSVFYSSKLAKYKGTDVIHLGKPTIEGGIEEGFAQLLEGDSVTFYIDAPKFFEAYLNSSVPNFINESEEIKITLRLLKIESPTEYLERVAEEEKVAELKEYESIDSIVNAWEQAGENVHERLGIYMVKGESASTDTLKYGMNANVFYKGYFASGDVFYDNTSNEFPDEYKVGIDGQNIEGMKIALLNLCAGQSAKIIVPSYLGIDEHLVKKGIYPAYSPLIFEIQVLPFKHLDTIQP